MLEFGSDEGGIPFVVGMHSDRGIAEHRLHSSRRDDDVRLGIVERSVAEADELALDVGVADLDVADRGLEHRRPVDETLGLIDQPVVVHLLEHGLDCPGQALVHGEAFTGPVDAVAESAHLLTDVAADLGLLLPDPLDEGIATEIVAGESLGSEFALDHGLHRNGGVVHAGQPQRLEALHACAAGQGVHQDVLVGVPHVQRPVDVGRRDDDGVRGLVTGSIRREIPGINPALVELRLVVGGVPGFRQCRRRVGHPSILGNAVVALHTVSDCLLMRPRRRASADRFGARGVG